MTKRCWPGTRIARSTDNAFAIGYGGAPIDWTRVRNSAAISAASTKKVERARAAGTDRSAIHGISKKADALLAHRHGGAFTRAKRGK